MPRASGGFFRRRGRAGRRIPGDGFEAPPLAPLRVRASPPRPALASAFPPRLASSHASGNTEPAAGNGGTRLRYGPSFPPAPPARFDQRPSGSFARAPGRHIRGLRQDSRLGTASGSAAYLASGGIAPAGAGRARRRCGRCRARTTAASDPPSRIIVPEWLNKSARYAVVWDIQERATKTTWTTTLTSAIQTTTSTPERTNPSSFLNTCAIFGYALTPTIPRLKVDPAGFCGSASRRGFASGPNLLGRTVPDRPRGPPWALGGRNQVGRAVPLARSEILVELRAGHAGPQVAQQQRHAARRLHEEVHPFRSALAEAADRGARSEGPAPGLGRVPYSPAAGPAGVANAGVSADAGKMAADVGQRVGRRIRGQGDARWGAHGLRLLGHPLGPALEGFGSPPCRARDRARRERRQSQGLAYGRQAQTTRTGWATSPTDFVRQVRSPCL